MDDKLNDTELIRLVKISYGESDIRFAGNKDEIENAQKALILAFELNLGLEQYINYHRKFLFYDKKVSKDHLDEQIERIRDLSYYFKFD
ncbi:hypothetical protein SAMN04488511_11981 [Pedobacter suwonensis]|uniref:Uncharacterized protein n=1 Tax=Pedobacter suwonensis TaxID=332999 RepID=A0A1I0U379_9SPHI|nr:hypothetical protein [Pedobacter suwonensis]SFA58512.1 hypothetical protein SAMN04488511_11981 [Pedobacter suwonensis]